MQKQIEIVYKCSDREGKQLNESVLRARKAGPKLLLNSASGQEDLSRYEDLEKLVQKILKDNRRILSYIQKSQEHVGEVEKRVQRVETTTQERGEKAVDNGQRDQ